MLALDEKNTEAQRLLALANANLPCEPVYKQAELAASRKRWKAALTLLQDIRDTCPDYGDPAGLWVRATMGGANLPMLEWCEIPAGRVEIGGKTYTMEAFIMAKYPVTNAQFRLFIDDPNGYSNPVWWAFSDKAKAWRKDHPQPEDEKYPGDNLPRVNVCWYEAMAFCRWLGAALNLPITLPTEAQWQRAAQGDDRREYPWGNTFDKSKCNTKESGIGQPTPVDRYPAGASPYGVMDMCGNVLEWCLNEPDSLENVRLSGEGSRALRAGLWNLNQVLARVAYRYHDHPNLRNFNRYRFRVVCGSALSLVSVESVL